MCTCAEACVFNVYADYVIFIPGSTIKKSTVKDLLCSFHNQKQNLRIQRQIPVNRITESFWYKT